MNKLLMIGLFLIAMLGISIAGGTIIGIITTKDIDLTYPAISLDGNYTKTDMIDFDEIDYEVKGNTITLNKKDLFQNKRISFDEIQTCLEQVPEECLKWGTTKETIQIDSNTKEDLEIPICLDLNLSYCNKWTNYTKQDFISMAIQKELEFVKSIQDVRNEKVTQEISNLGKIKIK